MKVTKFLNKHNVDKCLLLAKNKGQKYLPLFFLLCYNNKVNNYFWENVGNGKKQRQ